MHCVKKGIHPAFRPVVEIEAEKLWLDCLYELCDIYCGKHIHQSIMCSLLGNIVVFREMHKLERGPSFLVFVKEFHAIRTEIVHGPDKIKDIPS